MPSFRTGVVVGLLQERRGLQRVEVEMGSGPERAYVLTQLTGPVAVGDLVEWEPRADTAEFTPNRKSVV